MLDARERGALLEALRPPLGYSVHSAIATTYSLDLTALLTAPLAFSLYDRIATREGNEQERIDSFALLHAVRDHAERLVIFCQSGAIARPQNYRQLLAYLENSIVQVNSPSEFGVFHPKLWIQRFTSSDEEPVRYRVLCLSRNLTFDHSWDTMLVLDGELLERKLAISNSKPLAEFVEALANLALVPLSKSQNDIVANIADELRRVRFDVPDGFESLQFWPLGHNGKRRNPFDDERIERLLVVSPFLSANRLEILATQGKKHVLVSRSEELAQIPQDVLSKYSQVSVLSDPAEETDPEVNDQSGKATMSGPFPPTSGLHAKLYIADDGWNAHIWTGSANTTDAAFEHNVEFLIQLTGKKSVVGVEATLNAADGSGLGQLLVPFSPQERVDVDETEQKLASILRIANQRLSRTRWNARVEQEVTQDGSEKYTVTLEQLGAVLELSTDCQVRVWPITLSSDRALLLGPSGSIAFDRCSFQALTSFFAFEITATVGAKIERCEFVLSVMLEGAPRERSSRILRSLLDDPSKVMQFMRLLLSVDAFEVFNLLDTESSDDSSGTSAKPFASPVALFESLVRTLEQAPARLIEVERFVREIQTGAGQSSVLPDSFEQIWEPLWAAYQALPRSRRTS